MKHAVATNDPRGDQGHNGEGLHSAACAAGSTTLLPTLSCKPCLSLPNSHLLPYSPSNAPPGEGPPFMTFHRAFLLELEESLLAVCPDMKALPYWVRRVYRVSWAGGLGRRCRRHAPKAMTGHARQGALGSEHVVPYG